MNRHISLFAFFLGLFRRRLGRHRLHRRSPLASPSPSSCVIAAVYLAGAAEMRRYDRPPPPGQGPARHPRRPAHLGAWLAGCPPRCRTPSACASKANAWRCPARASRPYLVGLLVLLGMLGTFLGMVVTLNGGRAGAGKHHRPAHHPLGTGRAGQGPGRRLRHLGGRRRHLGHARPDFGPVPPRPPGGGAACSTARSPAPCATSRSPTSARKPSRPCRPSRRPARPGRQAGRHDEPDGRSSQPPGSASACWPASSASTRKPGHLHRTRPVGRSVAANQPEGQRNRWRKPSSRWSRRP